MDGDTYDIHKPPACGPFFGFWEGVRTPWDGLRYMNGSAGLWGYGVVPVILNLIITGVMLVLFVYLGVKLVNQWLPDYGDGWWWTMVEWVVVVVIVVAGLGVGFIVWVVLQGILCGHYYGKLAEEVERRIGIDDGEIREIPFSYQVIDALRDAGFLVMVNVGCLLIQLIPGFGSVLGVCGSFYFNCSTFGMEYLDYPLSLRGMRLKQKRAFVRKHRAHTLGLGAVVFAVTLVPVVGAVLLTTATTGAVLLHRRLGGAGSMSGDSTF